MHQTKGLRYVLDGECTEFTANLRTGRTRPRTPIYTGFFTRRGGCAPPSVNRPAKGDSV
ncbi:hypothetical protein DM75_1067 [Burkholderia mallei]|nr:hypothetical protein DM75_1067 [Burkholderia mallei]KGD22579.1 hypothetical protein DO70_4841 [Burkholderia pseudomallei]